MQLLSEIDQQDRVLNLDTDQGDNADGRGKGQGIAGQPQGGDRAKETQRNDPGHDDGAAETAKLEDQNRQYTKHRNGNRRAKAREAFRLSFSLPAERQAIAGRQGHLLFDPLERLCRDL